MSVRDFCITHGMMSAHAAYEYCRRDVIEALRDEVITESVISEHSIGDRLLLAALDNDDMETVRSIINSVFIVHRISHEKWPAVVYEMAMRGYYCNTRLQDLWNIHLDNVFSPLTETQIRSIRDKHPDLDYVPVFEMGGGIIDFCDEYPEQTINYEIDTQLNRSDEEIDILFKSVEGMYVNDYAKIVTNPVEVLILRPGATINEEIVSALTSVRSRCVAPRCLMSKIAEHAVNMKYKSDNMHFIIWYQICEIRGFDMMLEPIEDYWDGIPDYMQRPTTLVPDTMRALLSVINNPLHH